MAPAGKFMTLSQDAENKFYLAERGLKMWERLFGLGILVLNSTEPGNNPKGLLVDKLGGRLQQFWINGIGQKKSP